MTADIFNPEQRRLVREQNELLRVHELRVRDVERHLGKVAALQFEWKQSERTRPYAEAWAERYHRASTGK